jgi:hypothetical protein
MKKVMGILTIVLALVIGIVPLFTDCLSQGRSLTTTTGMSVPMKCHWTAIAEIGIAIPLAIVGIFDLFSKRKETYSLLALLGVVLGMLVIAFPTFLIGVCAKNDMLCNMVMKPLLIASGILVIAASIVVFVSSRKIVEQAS